MIEIEDKKTSWLQEDWDILIYLDGCRYDTFKEEYQKYLHCGGNLKMAKTFCSGTTKWMKDTFYKQDCNNIVYINPMYNFDLFVPNHNFFKVVNVWDTDWNNEYDTVMPDAITKRALQWINKYPNKRYIVQYVQPCKPYIHPMCKKVDQMLKPGGKKNRNARIIRSALEDTGMAKLIPNVVFWKLGAFFDYPISKGEIYMKYGKKGIIDAYIYSLREALKEVNKLIQNQKDKKIIVTSDHGELLGERGRYGHGGLVNKLIMQVPWLEINLKLPKMTVFGGISLIPDKPSKEEIEYFKKHWKEKNEKKNDD